MATDWSQFTPEPSTPAPAVDWSQFAPDGGAAPAPSTVDKIKAALGATGAQPYGTGAGYLIDNPITRGLGQSANTAATGLNELVNRVFIKPVDATVNALGGHSNLSGDFNQAMVAPGVATAQQLAAPATIGIGSAGTQMVSNLGGSIATAMAGGGADAGAPVAVEAAPSIAQVIRGAAASPATAVVCLPR